MAIGSALRIPATAVVNIGEVKLHATTVLLPENLRAYFELSAQAWILYKAPQWNARYPNPLARSE